MGVFAGRSLGPGTFSIMITVQQQDSRRKGWEATFGAARRKQPKQIEPSEYFVMDAAATVDWPTSAAQ